MNLSHIRSLNYFLSNQHKRRMATLIDLSRWNDIYRGMPHKIEFNDKYKVLLPKGNCDYQNTFVLQTLIKLGSPEMCYVISEDKELDQYEMSISEAVAKSAGTCVATFISCIPNKLAYFESGEARRRFVLYSNS